MAALDTKIAEVVKSAHKLADELRDCAQRLEDDERLSPQRTMLALADDVSRIESARRGWDDPDGSESLRAARAVRCMLANAGAIVTLKYIELRKAGHDPREAFTAEARRIHDVLRTDASLSHLEVANLVIALEAWWLDRLDRPGREPADAEKRSGALFELLKPIGAAAVWKSAAELWEKATG